MELQDNIRLYIALQLYEIGRFYPIFFIMSGNGSVDLEDLGNQALVFAYGHNVNLYEDVFNIALTSSINEIRITYTGLMKELEIARITFQDYSDKDYDQRQYAMQMGMRESHLAVGMHPQDFLEIKKDAVERAYSILANKKSRTEYDGCLREFRENFENAIPDNDASHDVLDDSSHDEELEDVDFNDGNDTFFEPSTVQAQAEDSEFPILTSHHHNDDIFDPFNLRDDKPRQKNVSFADQSFDFAQDPFAVPVSPDGSIALAASFNGMHPHGHETAVRICALPVPGSEDSSYSNLPEGEHRRLEPEGDILLISDLSSEEEDELVSFQKLSKSMSDMEQKQEQFFSQMDAGLDNVECFSQDDSGIVERDNADRMSITAVPNEGLELEEDRQGQHVLNCLDACMEEVTGTLDDTALTIEQICWISPVQ